MRKTLALAAVAAAALGLASTANAETINVNGSVDQVCALSPGDTTVAFGDLGTQGNVGPISINYSLYCNVNFATTFSSANGRLRNMSVSSGTIGPENDPGAHSYNGSSQFFAALDYVITPSIGGPVSSASFDGGVITPLGNNPPSSYPVTLSFDTVHLTGGSQLTAGSYSDTLTINISGIGL